MTQIPNQWIYPSNTDPLQQIIRQFGKPEELKEKIFYLSLFVNADIIKQIAIMYHKVVYQFKSLEEFVLNFTNNKYQVSNCKDYWFTDILKYVQSIYYKICISFYVTYYDDFYQNRDGHYFYGIFINSNLDINKIKSISISNYDKKIEIDLTEPYIVNEHGKLFRLKNIPLFAIDFDEDNDNCMSFISEYSNAEMLNNIRTCTILSPYKFSMSENFKIKKQDGSYDILKYSFYPNYTGSMADFQDVQTITLL